MSESQHPKSLGRYLETLVRNVLSPLDFLPEGSPEEKIISLSLNGPPGGGSTKLNALFQETLEAIGQVDTGNLRVVILGGGTGLSNIVGGDSRGEDWRDEPFTGLKEIFPGIASIVCVTDDGGSTGELLKYLPLIGLGDLRHVLVSSIRQEMLEELYGLDDEESKNLAGALHEIFNYRFHEPDITANELLKRLARIDSLPPDLFDYIQQLIERLFNGSRLKRIFRQPQCLGNLLIASAVFGYIDADIQNGDLLDNQQQLDQATLQGLGEISRHIGVHEDGVLPCLTTPAQLQLLYANGVLVTGEDKSAHARRGYPVDQAIVKFHCPPNIPPAVTAALEKADIIIFAPGSLYSSIIPVLQVPGIADLIRENRRALKILVSNIWVQKGETDATRDAPERKFHVSDLVRAYNRNIPGGVNGLFSHILTIGLGEIPGSILQNYALEEKEPIYLDRQQLRDIGFEPVEAGIFSTGKLRRRHVIQHDPSALARAVHTLWCLHKEKYLQVGRTRTTLHAPSRYSIPVGGEGFHPCRRFEKIENWLAGLTVQRAANGNGDRLTVRGNERENLLGKIGEILWEHPDILTDHLHYTKAILLVDSRYWLRCQEWDNIFSFYEPADESIVIREDQLGALHRFAMAFLVALGQSLLGNYALEKNMTDVVEAGEKLGRMYSLVLRDEKEYRGYFNPDELSRYLVTARMYKSLSNPLHYTRLINSDEGFTPPGLLFGLFYTWYLDNRFASHIEYKMSIMRHTISDLIPELVKLVRRREQLIDFFRERVFRHDLILEKRAG